MDLHGSRTDLAQSINTYSTFDRTLLNNVHMISYIKLELTRDRFCFITFNYVSFVMFCYKSLQCAIAAFVYVP